MIINKEILKIFLESPDWTNEKTLNIFEKYNLDYEDRIENLNKKLKRVKDLLIKSLNGYKDSLDRIKELEDLNKKKIGFLKINSNIQNFFSNLKKIKEEKWSYKKKCKQIIILLSLYKDNIISLMNKEWYNNCIKLIKKYPNNNNYEELYECFIKLENDIFFKIKNKV